MTTNRERQRDEFLSRHGWSDADMTLLVPDASFRSYARLSKPDGSICMLMDAPPQSEDLEAYLKVNQHLASLGLRVAATYADDLAGGFALIEDMGDDTFTRLLASGHDEKALYLMAADVLKALHGQSSATSLELKPYDMGALLREVELFVDWFVPAARGVPATAAEKGAYLQAWRGAIAEVAERCEALVLRDYHVDNLMAVEGADSLSRCGLLDYQDALIGARAYDLVSLVEDARRDIEAGIREAVLERYFDGMSDAEAARIKSDMVLLGAQRHAKVAGIFVRLFERDGKPIYLRHIPRVLHLLEKCLEHESLTVVRVITKAMVPNYQSITF